MRAQCCICADLFENTSDINIAAAPCGHTFHELCLMQWLEKSSTCPSCRVQVRQNKVLRRLYFDIREDDDGNHDPAGLINQNESLKAQISQFKKVKKDLAEERDGLAVALATCQSEKEEANMRIKDTESKYKTAAKELATNEKLILSYQRELREFVETQKMLKKLQHLNTLLTDTEQECSELLSCYSGGGEASVQQLTQMIGVIKREYNKTLSDKKILRDEVKRLKGEKVTHVQELGRIKKEFKALQTKAEMADQEIFSLEREINSKRRKIAHLRCAVKHDKTEGSQSFIAAVTEDSPNVAYTPPASSLKETENVMKVPSPRITSPDLFDDSFTGTKSVPDVEMASQCTEDISDTPTLKHIPFTSAADRFKSIKKAKVEQEKDAPPAMPFANFNIMQKKMTGVSGSRLYSATQSRAFDGFGGSKKVELDASLGPSKKALLKFGPKKIVSKRKPLAPTTGGNKPTSVNHLFKGLSTTKSMSSLTSDKTLSTSSNCSKFSRTTSREDLAEQFAHIKPILAKSSSKKKDSIIDLTEELENDLSS